MAGGGTGNDGGSQPQVYQNANSQTNDATRAAAEAIPAYGSVSQLYGANPNSAAQVEKAGNGYSITLPSNSGTAIELNTVNDKLGNDVSVSVRIPGVEAKGYALEKNSNDRSTLAGVYELDVTADGNWIVAGWWLHGAGLMGDQPTFEVGSFVDGPEISSDPTLPSGGTAGYNGDATGLYTIIPGTDLDEGGIIIGEYIGDFAATATFNNGGGTVSGRVIVTSSNDYFLVTDDYAYSGSDYVEGVEIHWNDVEFSSNGEATGDITSVSYPGLVFTEVKGKTGNKFSSIADSDGNPRFIAGTHGGSVETSGGTQAGFIGVHGGGTGR